MHKRGVILTKCINMYPLGNNLGTYVLLREKKGYHPSDRFFFFFFFYESGFAYFNHYLLDEALKLHTKYVL